VLNLIVDGPVETARSAPALEPVADERADNAVRAPGLGHGVHAMSCAIPC